MKQDFKFSFLGAEYVVPANQISDAVEQVERRLTAEQLIELGERGTVAMGRLAGAYGALFRFIRVQISDEEVYARMLAAGKLDETVTEMMSGIVALMRADALMERP